MSAAAVSKNPRRLTGATTVNWKFTGRPCNKKGEIAAVVRMSEKDKIYIRLKEQYSAENWLFLL